MHFCFVLCAIHAPFDLLHLVHAETLAWQNVHSLKLLRICLQIGFDFQVKFQNFRALNGKVKALTIHASFGFLCSAKICQKGFATLEHFASANLSKPKPHFEFSNLEFEETNMTVSSLSNAAVQSFQKSFKTVFQLILRKQMTYWTFWHILEKQFKFLKNDLNQCQMIFGDFKCSHKFSQTKSRNSSRSKDKKKTESSFAT